MIEQGILQSHQVEQLKQELSLDGLNTISAPTAVKASSFSESGERIALFGRYVQLEFLGLGGMARVYKAYDPSLARHVALKFVKVEDPQYAHRLLQEARSQARIEHEHVCKIYETGEVEGKPYIAMQYITGQTLKQLNESLPLRQKVELIRQVADGVHAAHKAGLIHRDLKPANILIEQRETGPEAYVMDFGLAREIQTSALTMTGLIVGTPSYMSPEQARGQTDKIDSRTDIYSIGATLYELITGRPPFVGASTTEILMQIVEKEPVPPRKLQPSLPMDLQTIVLKCLDKNPDRRYASARSLSEDLSRFLDGDPIRATAATWMYRTNKRIRKHPVISGLLAAAFLVVVILAAMTGFVQWRANKQANLFQEFGVEVTGIQAIMRYAYLLPLHDVQQEKKQVTERLEHIKNRMNVLGKLSYAPGNYSLGKGYLSLHQYQKANDHLIQAWQKYNYREPAVANALGLSLAMLYQEKLAEAEQAYSKDQLQQRKEALAQKYRVPALQYIQQGSSASESPEYVAALISFLEHNYPEALKKSESAMRRVSWLYEAQILEGNIFTAIANEHREKGENVPAGEFYEKAKNAYLSAAKKGQSDPQVYEGLCALQASIQEMLLTEKGTSPESVANQGINFCETALQADPKDVNANLLGSKIYNRWMYDQAIHGLDASISLEKAAHFAKEALKIDADNGPAYRSLGNAYHVFAAAEMYKGKDPIPFLDLANANFEKAIIRMPEDHDLLSLAGNDFVLRARYESQSGKDPRPTIERATKFLRKAVEVNPEYFKTYSNLGTAYYCRAEYESVAGLDPRQSLEQAIQLFKKSIKMNPNYANSHEYAGVAYFSLAEFLADIGNDPVPSLDESIAAYSKCLKLAVEDPFCSLGLGSGFMKKGNALQLMGKDPTAELESAREAFRISLKGNDQIVSAYSFIAEAELIAARNARAQHRSPEPFFQEAARILQAAAKVSSDCPECLETVAAMHLQRAEYSISMRQSAEKDIRLGIEAADSALKQNSASAYGHAYRAKLFLLRAQSLSGESSKKAAQEAAADFDETFKRNRYLKKRFNTDWEQAKLLAQASS